MNDKQKIEFRQLQAMFFERMSQYPGDKETLEKMLQIFDAWIDKQIDQAIVKILAANAKLKIN